MVALARFYTARREYAKAAQAYEVLADVPVTGPRQELTLEQRAEYLALATLQVRAWVSLSLRFGEVVSEAGCAHGCISAGRADRQGLNRKGLPGPDTIASPIWEPLPTTPPALRLPGAKLWGGCAPGPAHGQGQGAGGAEAHPGDADKGR